MFTTVDRICVAALGFKSLQNNFFYLNKETIQTYGIEDEFLEPVFRFKQLDGEAYLQKPKPRTWLFHCKRTHSDLRGTGALRYIDTMAGRSATEKKQSGGTKTIRQVLEAQGGGLWYAPKASLHRHRLWMRKAIDGVYSPFVFKAPVLVDQRCNYLTPNRDVLWGVLGAAVTTTIFSYSIEINGSASMGAGALEAATTKLRNYPILDVRELNKKEQTTLISLAKAVWKNEAPVDWSSDSVPGESLQELDTWILKKARKPIGLEALYDDLRAACTARLQVAADKQAVTQKKKSESIANVAAVIAAAVGRLLEAKRYPESFFAMDTPIISITLPAGVAHTIELRPMLGNADFHVYGQKRAALFGGSYNRHVAEAITHGLLLGRTNFQVPEDGKAAERGVANFLTWFEEVLKRLDEEISRSALGTGYEDTLRKKVFQLLGIHPAVGAKELPHRIDLLLGKE